MYIFITDIYTFEARGKYYSKTYVTLFSNSIALLSKLLAVEAKLVFRESRLVTAEFIFF